LDEVIDHYKNGGVKSPNSDPLVHKLPLNQFYVNALKAFIATFTDTVFYNNPELKNPFK
jgi:hypothetical protein